MIHWTPYSLISLLGIFSCESLISPTTSMIPALVAKCASVSDPYVYFFSHPRYKREAKDGARARVSTAGCVFIQLF